MADLPELVRERRRVVHAERNWNNKKKVQESVKQVFTGMSG